MNSSGRNHASMDGRNGGESDASGLVIGEAEDHPVLLEGPLHAAGLNMRTGNLVAVMYRGGGTPCLPRHMAGPFHWGRYRQNLP